MNFTRGRLARQSLRHYRRAHLPTACGIALAAAVLSGALLVGDTVRGTLARFARDRLGRVAWALEVPPGRRMADSLGTRIPGGGSVLTLPAMLLADAADGVPVQVNHARVLGVDASAWRLIAGDAVLPPKKGDVLLGARLARRLGVGEGDPVSLRVARWSALPRDAPLSARAEVPTARWRATVRQILPDSAGGRFGLEASQTAPLNAFVPLATLQEQAGWDGFANLLVADRDSQTALRAAWTPEDMGLLVSEGNGVGRIVGDGIFLETAVADALPRPNVLGFTYLVDAIETADGSRRTPYSFVMGLTPQDNRALGCVPADTGADGIAVNAWLAECLGVETGDVVVVRSRRWDATGGVTAESRPCRVRRIVPMDQAEIERHRMPAFPGLTDVERCAEWDIGMDLDPGELADAANEAYWREFGPTPKAFLSLETVQSMAGTRFGTAMEARVALGPDGVAEDAPALLAALRQRLDPATAGFAGRDVAQAARTAARGATDVGGLFLGLSFFLMAAALLLSALLGGLAILRRNGELGALRAAGFADGTLRSLMRRETAAVAAAGSLVGALLGLAYAHLLLRALARGWADAFAGTFSGTAVPLAGSFRPVASGAVLAMAAGFLTLEATLRKTLRSPLPALLTGDPGDRKDRTKTVSRLRAWGLPCMALLVGGTLARLGPYAAMAGGAVVLAGGVWTYRDWGRRRLKGGDPKAPARDRAAVGRRGALLRPGRDLAVMAVMASGIFLVCAVTAMRQDITRHAEERKAPTGGFEWWVDLSVPVPDHALPRDPQWTLTPLRVRAGEDAGCLNLNQVATPRLVGVPVARFVELGVFGLTDEWHELDASRTDGTIPGWAGDADTATWGLKATLGTRKGTVLDYRSENGNDWPVRLTRAPPHRLTLFQGCVLVSAERLAQAYPGLGGSAWILVDRNGNAADSAEGIPARLRDRFERQGAEVLRVTDRLREFYQVEATYLDMFLVLGGLGLLVATLGVGLVALRNAEERGEEIETLTMLGFRRRDRARLLWDAVMPAQAAGLAVGTLAAAVALWPAIHATGAGIPWGRLVLLLAWIGPCGVFGSLLLAWRGASRPAQSPSGAA